MSTSAENFIPILFNVLFGFVSLNMLLNFVLLYTRPMRLNKLLAIYWPLLFLHFLLQGYFQSGNLRMSLAYSAVYAITLVAAMIAFEAVGRQFPLKKYILFILPFYPLTVYLDYLGYGFTVVAMPFCLATAVPFLHSSYYLTMGKTATRLQKVLGIVYFLQAVHSLNYALFRLDPGAQLWGWFVSYTLCDVLAILLPTIALEHYGLSEAKRLQNLVNEKTQDLNNSLLATDKLFKVLVHDISNPLSVMKFYLQFMQEHPEKRDAYFKNLTKSQVSMENIIDEVKEIYKSKSQMKELGPVAIEDCFRELAFIFEQPLLNKNLRLKLDNQLPSNFAIKANHTSLTHSVLSNLISNSIKFTEPNSEIEIIVRKVNSNVILEVRDQGPGIPVHVIQAVMSNKNFQSTVGTEGQKGTGLGLSIAKSFIDSYGGQLDIAGSNIRITLDCV